ncbi:hypothetical protein H3L97_02635 [Alysiella filiformis]|nr:hypothetical protein H3L97_02635 [Alysiella filiformis]
MKLLCCTLLAGAALSACTWETYQKDNGATALRQKYPAGTGVYYTNGAASQNTHYHGNRPQQHAIVPQKSE